MDSIDFSIGTGQIIRRFVRKSGRSMSTYLEPVQYGAPVARGEDNSIEAISLTIFKLNYVTLYPFHGGTNLEKQ